MASYEKSLKEIFEKADNDLKRIEAENIIKHYRSKSNRNRAHSPDTNGWSNLPGASLANDLKDVFENEKKANKKSRKGGKSRKNRKSRKRHN